MRRRAEARVRRKRRVPQRTRAIRRLAKLRETFGPDAAAERERLLRACGGARCRSGKELSSLHETLCFARAYPDNQAVLDLVQDLLDRWERRTDLHALGQALQGLGMAGVANAYAFFWPTARWLPSAGRARCTWTGITWRTPTAWRRCSSCSCRAPSHPPSRSCR